MEHNFNIKVAASAHKEGQEAFKAGLSKTMNPYVKVQEDYNDESYLKYRNWENGWNFAYLQSLRNVKGLGE